MLVAWLLLVAIGEEGKRGAGKDPRASAEHTYTFIQTAYAVQCREFAQRRDYNNDSERGEGRNKAGEGEGGRRSVSGVRKALN